MSSILHPEPNGTVHVHADSSRNRPFVWAALLAGLLFILSSATSARADQSPPGCTGSGLGILLFTDSPDVHIGDTLNYSITVYNGTGFGPIVCDASSIQAFVVTPDGVSHPITLVRTTLTSGQGDYYTNVVSYVVRAQDIQPDGTVRATASDTGVIHQNDVNSQGGGNQGVNTQVSLPCVQLTVQCAGGVGENGAITFTGTVTNCGNDTLVGVTVTNFVNGAQFPVTFITNLARGQIASFSGSWVPSNPCSPSTATLVAQGVDQFTAHPRTVTSSVGTACSEALTPGISVTKFCPAQPVAPGQLLTFSGSVSNTGNVTLINIVVVNNQPAPNTTVFTLASLAPGALASFTGSYVAPANCSVSDTLVASASSRCGVPVTSTVSATCPILTTPQIAVTAVCPATQALPGGSLTYSGTVQNTGNVTLTNVVVLSDRPAANTTVFTVATLAPGALASFTGTSIAPTNTCAVTTAFSGIGRDVCTLNAITNSVLATCSITTAPAIAVTLACPAMPASPGGSITYTGTVRNSGNVTLNNVFVVNNQPGPNTPVIGPVTLAPGTAVNFTTSFTAASDTCSASCTVRATGSDNCTAVVVTNTASTSCTLTTTPGIVLFQSCPVNPPAPGTLLTYSGMVVNSGNVTLTNVVVLNNLSGATPVFTVATLASGATANFTGSYLAPTNCSTTSISTATGQSICGGAVTNTASTTCPILTTPQIVVTAVCPAVPVLPGGSLTYSGTVRNTGNITLTNVVVTSDRPAANTTVFTVATLAPGASVNFTGTSTVPTNVCAVTANFSGTGRDICTLNAVTNNVSTTCTVLTAPGIAVTLACPVVSVNPGGLIVYTGTVRNSGNVTLDNVTVVNNQAVPNTVLTVPALTPGASASFTASFAAPVDACSISSTVTASGSDACTAIVVNNSASATCTLVITPRIAVTQNCPTTAPGLGGVLAYSGTVSNAGNITLTNVVVISDRTGTSPVFTTATLAPGASTNFIGSYTVPTNSACAITSTLTAKANDKCAGALITASATSTCPVQGAANIAVTLACPATPTSLGGLLTFSGTVRNAGNLTLTNVVVTRSAPAPNTVVFNAVSLAPGASGNFTGSYTVPGSNACSIATSVSASANEQCAGSSVIASATTVCPLVTTPSIIITQNCSTNPTSPGGVLTYSGTVSNAGNITLSNIVVVNNQHAPDISSGPANFGTLTPPLVPPAGTVTDRFGVGNNFNGLTFAGPDEGYAVNQFYSLRHDVSGSSTFVTINANGTVTGRFDAGNKNFDALAFAAPDVGYGPAIFYYLRHDSAGVSTFGTIKPGGVVGVVTDLFVVGNNFDALTFAATDVGYGANLFYYLRHDGTGRSTFGTINPALPGTITDRFNVGTNFDALVFTATDVGYGANLFYYLRHDGTGRSTFGTISATGTVTDRFSVGTNFNELAFTTADVGFAANLFYYLHAGGNPQPVFALPSLAPGASTNFIGSYTVPSSNACSVTAIATVTATDICTGNSVTNIVTTTCPLTTAPRIAVTLNCPVVPVAIGGLITYTGTVNNPGNVTLNNVVVVDSQTSPGTVLTLPSLAPGASANFTASFTTPANACSVSSTVTASGSDACTAAMVTNIASATCTLATAPVIAVTLNCPVVPVATGGLITYTGTVNNPGNVTLNNVVVVDSQTSPGTVLALPSLAPGASANFTASFTTPANACSVSSTVTASGSDACTAAMVTNIASATCTLATAPRIVVTQNCPANPASVGGVLAYSGTVSNAGNITLTNVVVTNDRSGATPVFTAATLTPGASANFTGSYTVPANSGCSITSTLTGSGYDKCTGIRVTTSAPSTCPLLTAPRITITQTCPVILVGPGGILTYSGTVSNAGTSTLTNIIVVNNRPASNTVIFTAATLAPGAKTNFTGSYEVPLNCCVVSSTVGATGQDICTGVIVADTFTATCTVLTMPQIVVTKVCPPTAVQTGGVLQYNGTVSNAGNITLVSVTIVNTQPSVGSPVLGPITLAPGESVSYYASYVVASDFCGTDTVTARGLDACSFAPVVNSVTTTCPVITAPRIAVTKNCPLQITPRGGVLTYTGTVSNPGNVTLTNVVVTDNYQIDCFLRTNGPVIGPITLAPGASTNFSGSYTAPLSCCEALDTLTASGQDRCSGNRVTATATALCPLLSSPRITVTKVCPGSSVPVGGLFTYSGSVSNAGDVVLTNVYVVASQPNANTPLFGPIELAPGETKAFSGGYTVTAGSNPAIGTVTARGTDTCQGQTVTAMANCFGPFSPLTIISVTLANGMATVTWAAIPGTVYTLQFQTGVPGSSWTNIPGNVTASSNTASKTDAMGSSKQRLYRVMVVP